MRATKRDRDGDGLQASPELELRTPLADIVDVLRSRLLLRSAAAVVCVLLVPAVAVGSARGGSGAEQRIFGVTVDDLSRLPAVLDSLRALPRPPWVRMVFDVDLNRPASPARYTRAVRRVARIGPVLGELVDSSDIRRLTVAQVKARASAYVRALRSSVSVWEIGNEVNGDWTGSPALVARKVQIAYETVRPSPAQWTRRFASLHHLFPNAQVGFGEIGMPQPATPATRAAAASLIDYYYRLNVPLSYYIGGGFYWYFAEDMVPWRSSLLWGALARSWSVKASSPPSAPATTAAVDAPPPHAAFSYQIGGVSRPAAGVAVVDRDWHAAPAPGTYGICYLNAFQAQPEELVWWRSHHPSLLLRRDGRPVIDNTWNEQLLDTSTPAKREALAGIIGGWIDRCAQAGYRAVEPDNLDSWTRSGGALTGADNLALAQLLIARAHAAGLAIAQKNAAELASVGRRIGFDFAIAEECQAFGECGSYLSAYGDRVIEIEYPDNGGERNFERACRLRGNRISIVYRDRNVTPAGHPGFIERRCP